MKFGNCLRLSLISVISLFTSTLVHANDTHFSAAIKYWGMSTSATSNTIAAETYQYAHIPSVAATLNHRRIYAGFNYAGGKVSSSLGALRIATNVNDIDLYAGYFVFDQIALFIDYKRITTTTQANLSDGTSAGGGNGAQNGFGAGISAFQSLSRDVYLFGNVGGTVGRANYTSNDPTDGANNQITNQINALTGEIGATWAPMSNSWRLLAGYKIRRNVQNALLNGDITIEHGITIGSSYSFN